jgi:hypothetical protein
MKKISYRNRNFMNSVKYWYCDYDLTYSSGFESKQEHFVHYEHSGILDAKDHHPYIAEMVYPHQPTSLLALDHPLISSHEPTYHWSPDESEDRMMCNFNSGERGEAKELCIHLHKLFHSLFFFVTHCTVLPFFHHIYIFLNLVFKISEFTKEQGNVISFQTSCERNSLDDKKSKALKIVKHISQSTCVPTNEG